MTSQQVSDISKLIPPSTSHVHGAGRFGRYTLAVGMFAFSNYVAAGLPQDSVLAESWKATSYGRLIYAPSDQTSDIVRAEQPTVTLIQEVFEQLKPTRTRLAQVLGVSRTSLNSWQDGSIDGPRDSKVRSRLISLNAAIGSFQKAGITPDAYILERPISNGKGFWDIVQNDGDAEEVANALCARIALDARERLSIGSPDGESPARTSAEFSLNRFSEFS